MMNQEDLLKKTGSILKELQEQFEFLTNNAQRISELELELFLANANFLTDHIQILRKLTNSKTQKSLPEHTPVHVSELQEPAPVKVYDDLFKPDNDSPTFEFIVNEKLKQSAPELPVAPEEDETWISKDKGDLNWKQEAPEVPEEEPDHENIIEAQDETIIAESSPISQIVPETVLQHDSGSTLPDIRPDVDEDEVFFSEPELEVVPEPEEDEIGPEPFLVSKEAEPVVPEPSISEPSISEARMPERSIPEQSRPEPVRAEQKIPEETPVIPVRAAEEPLTTKHQPTLNELLAGQAAPSNAANARPAISDLKSAINLNAKLLFVKDLFEGYSLAYSEAIDIVNKMPDFNSADKFLQSNYAAKHNWAAKQSTVEQFYELLHQRFPK
jgi:hypothetical protein